MNTRPSPSHLILLLSLGVVGSACSPGGGGVAGSCTAFLGAASWAGLDGLSLDVPFVGEGVMVTTTEEPTGACTVYGTGTVTTPSGSALPSQDIEFPGTWDVGVLAVPGTYSLHADVVSASSGYNPEPGQLDLDVYVAPRPDCNNLVIPGLDGRDFLTAGDVVDMAGAEMVCLAASGGDDADAPVAAGTEIGHVTAFALTSSGGGKLVGGHDEGLCSFPQADGTSCSLEVLGPDSVQLSASGLLQTEADPAESYFDGYSAATEVPVGFAPMITCTVSDLTPDVGTNDLEVVVQSTVADGSDVRLDWGTTVHRASGEDIVVASDGVVSHANEVYHLPLLDEIVLAQAEGEIRYVVTATSTAGLQQSCEGTIPVGELDPPGNWVRPTALDAFISPDVPFATQGSFELRLVVQPDDGHDGDYLDISGDEEHLSLRRERDTIYLDYGGFRFSDAGYGFGSYDQGILAAPLGRADARPLTQEIRISVTPDAVYLAVDGLIYDWVDREFDFTGLSQTRAELGDATLAHFESFGFFPGYPAGGLPWATPCSSGHTEPGAWCADFDAIDSTTLTDTEVVDEPTGSFTVSGSFEVGTL